MLRTDRRAAVEAYIRGNPVLQVTEAGPKAEGVLVPPVAIAFAVAFVQALCEFSAETAGRESALALPREAVAGPALAALVADLLVRNVVVDALVPGASHLRAVIPSKALVADAEVVLADAVARAVHWAGRRVVLP